MHPLDNEALKQGAKAVRRRRLDAENRQDFISLLGRIVVILLCAWVLFTQVFLLTQAKGSSMFPAVKDGDLLICYRLQKTYAKKRRCGLHPGRQAPGGPHPWARGRPCGSGRQRHPCGERRGAERRDPLPHLRKRRAGVPLHGAGRLLFCAGRLPHTIRGQPGLWPGSAGGCASKSNYTTAATQFVIPRKPEEAAGILPVNRGVWAAAQEYELFLTREE